MPCAGDLAFAPGLEEVQNTRNKITARSRFFARKIHKLKKMLRPLFTRKHYAPAPARTEEVFCPCSEEDDNALNEALEARLCEDLATSPRSGDAIRALEDGELTIVVVSPGASVPVPASFFTPTPGKFSWTFLSPDYDICPRGDHNALSFSQIPEQQTPPPSPH